MKIIHLTATAKQKTERLKEGAGWVSTVAKEYKKSFPNAEMEIWQIMPGLDDKAVLDGSDGLIYRYFPGNINEQNFAESEFLLDWLSRQNYEQYVFHVHGQLRGVCSQFVYKFGRKNHIIFSFWGPINPKLSEWHDERVNNINCVTYCNDYKLDEFEKVYKGSINNLTVGVNTDFFRPIDKVNCKNKLLISEGRFVMLMVARFISWKQIEDFIEIIQLIPDDFLLLIVGDGPLNSSIRDKAQELVSLDKVQFLGSISRESQKILTVLNAADLFVTVSKGEGASGAVMEAMACELPIFTTNFGGTVKFLKKNDAGVIVSIDSKEEWREKLEKIIHGSVDVLVADRNEVVDTYSWVSVISKLHSLYQICLEH